MSCSKQYNEIIAFKAFHSAFSGYHLAQACDTLPTSSDLTSTILSRDLPSDVGCDTLIFGGALVTEVKKQLTGDLS